MIDGSRFNRLPNSLTVIPPYSRAIYTSIDLVFTHCRCRPACTSVLASVPCFRRLHLIKPKISLSSFSAPLAGPLPPSCQSPSRISRLLKTSDPPSRNTARHALDLRLPL